MGPDLPGAAGDPSRPIWGATEGRWGPGSTKKGRQRGRPLSRPMRSRSRSRSGRVTSENALILSRISMIKPEELVREIIDAKLAEAGADGF